MKVILIINSLLILIGSYFIFESIKYRDFYNSLKKKLPEQVNINFYKKGKYEFEFSNNNTTQYTTAVLALGIAGVETNCLNNNDMKQLKCNYEIYNEGKRQVVSKKMDLGNISLEKISPNQQLIPLQSIKWLPDGKYKIIFEVSSPWQKNSLRNCKLFLMRHIAFGELLGRISLYKYVGLFFFLISGLTFLTYFVFRKRSPSKPNTSTNPPLRG